MASDRKTLALASLAGLATGTLAWFMLKPLVDRQIESSVRAQLEQQIPEQLSRELDAKLRQYGITPEATAALSRAIQGASHAGIFGVGR